MKKFLKIISALLAVCVSASLFGCNTTKEEPAGGGSGSGNGGGSQTVDPNPPSSSGKEPASPDKDPEDGNDRDKPVVAPTDKEGAISAFNGFLASLADKKFSYDLRTVKYSIDGNIMKVYDDGYGDKFFEKKDVKYYYYKFSKQDDCYYRTEYDLTYNIDFFAEVDDMLSSLQGISWASFEGGVLSGTNGGKSVTYEVANSRNVVTVGTQRMEFHDVGATLTLPPWKEKEPEPPAEEKLYDAQGNLNYPLFAETLENWMNDGYYSSKIAIASITSPIKIDYIDIDELNNITFGSYVEAGWTGEDLHEYYQNFSISSTDLKNKIIGKEFVRPENLRAYLDTLTGTPVISKGAKQVDKQYETAELMQIAQNILDRLATVGYQGNSINNVGTKVNDYVGATVLSVRKGKNVGGTSAYDMGTVYDCDDINIIVKQKNGDLCILTFRLAFSTSGGVDNVLKNVEKKWIIKGYTTKLIDYTPYAN